MKDHDDGVAEAVLREAQLILGGLAHVEVLRTAPRESHVSASRSLLSPRQRAGHTRILGGLKVEVMGWTPSLHHHHLEIDCAFPKDVGPVQAAAGSHAALATFASAQRRRMALARSAHGRDTPFGLVPGTDLSEVDHLDCDRYTLETLVKTHGGVEAVRSHIGLCVTNINDGNAGDDQWLRGTTYGERIRHGDLAIDGERIFYAAPLPQTIIGTLEGRPLGDLVDVKGRQAARRIVAARIEEAAVHPLVTIDIEPDTVRIGSHLDMMGASSTIPA